MPVSFIVLSMCNSTPPTEEPGRRIVHGTRTGEDATAVRRYLPSETAENVEAFIDSVPPGTGYPAAAVLADFAEVAPRPEAGRLRTGFLVVNAGATSLQLSLVCLRNLVQVACAAPTSVWDITLPPHTADVAPINLPASSTDRVDILAPIDGDWFRIFRGSLWQTAPRPSQENACGGHATLQRPGAFQSDGTVVDKRPFRFQRDEDIHLDVVGCDGSHKVEVQAVMLTDRREVTYPPGAIWRSPIKIDRHASFRIPRDYFRDAEEIQVFVIPTELDHQTGQWVTNQVVREKPPPPPEFTTTGPN